MIMNMNPYLGFRKAANFKSIFFFSIIQMYKKLKWKNINRASYYWISECRKWINFSLNNSRFGDFVDRIYPIELEIKDSTVTDRSASYLDLHLEIDSEGRLRTKFKTKEMISIFPLWTFHLYVATFQQHLHMEYISLRWYDIPELVVPIRNSLI